MWPRLGAAALLVAAGAHLVAEARPGEASPGVGFDVVIRGGTVYDGTGRPPIRADVGLRGDRIAAVGDLSGASARSTIDAKGMAVAPGFINMLSWAVDALIVDGRSMSDIAQGVTLEIFGEGWSMGPLDDWMKADATSLQGDIKYDITWTTLGEYLDQLVERGVSPNVASFVGATTLRMRELRYENRAPSPEELARMQELTREAMREGALGVGASLIYAPAFYAGTPELIALARAAGESGGGFIAHIRSEANKLLEAVDELIEIAREAGVRGEIYHFKAAGEANWPKMAEAIARVEKARAEGLSIGADMYTYVAGATGLDAAMPPWVQEGGLDAWVKRLKDPEIRARVIREMRAPSDAWENLAMQAGSPERILLNGFKSEALKPLTGRTVAEVARARGLSPEETMIDLVIEDHSRVECAYFLMSEENVRLGIRQPWVAFGSDAESSAPEGVFLKSSTHPRAYGNFARLLGRYVREEKLISLSEAVRRLTGLPAERWKLEDRGCLREGCFADVAVFDPDRISDHATFETPRRYATGVRDVFVNGVQVLRDGAHTGAKPGRVVRGPGWCGRKPEGCAAPAHDAAFWRGIAENGYAVPEGDSAAALLGELDTLLASPDPEMRDTFGYGIAANWIYKQRLLSDDELRSLVARLTRNLTKGIGGSGTDSVLLRSFSALDLSILAALDNEHPYLGAEGFEELLAAALAYSRDEKDLRGYVSGKGWHHSAAHTADLLKFLARNRDLKPADQGRVLDAVAAKLDCGQVFVWGEDERLARTVLSILARGDFDAVRFEAWLSSLAGRSEGLWDGELDTARFAAVQNTKNLLRSLHAILSGAKDKGPEVDAAAGKILTALSAL